MNYAEARAWLESLGEFHMEFGLERVKTVLAALENPERCAPAIHVAGTNGKGQTCAFAAGILRHAGKRVGLYTSPHLSRPNERIAILGFPLDEDRFASALSEAREASDRVKAPLTYFEAMTCAGFQAFARARVDAMVVEVGLGGRLDATNVLDPEVSVITSVSLDHTHILGDTIEAIAAEKAGIVKPGRPVVVTARDPAARRVIEARAAGSPAWWLTGESLVEEAGHRRLRIPGGDVVLPPPIADAGAQKLDSAAAAAAAVRTWLPHVEDRVVREGIADSVWPGRGETIRRDGVHVLLDGAHNPAAARALVDTETSSSPHVLLFAAMTDKDRRGVLREHRAWPPRAIVCTSAGTARSASARVLAEDAREVFQDSVPIEAIDGIETALTRARELAAGARIVVTGSLYLVGRVREIVTGGPPTRLG